jgi:DNA-binding SARP family transcriptional activator/TolB-like protein/Flp pilus assembly protein TadD
MVKSSISLVDEAQAEEGVAIRLRLIGQMEAWTVNSESVLPPGKKTRALLAIVVLSAPKPMLRSRLAELLWSRRPEEQARASLRQEIHRLLEVLSPAGQEILAINRDSLALRPGTVWVDVDEVLRATTANPGALALLDSELLEELDGVDPAFDVWLHSERERLRDRARKVAEDLLSEQVAPEQLIPVAQQLLAIDRAHEGAWRALMRAHAERGERAMAIQSYDRCRAVLADMLDAAPSPETQALLAEIRSGKSVRVVPSAPAPSPVEPPRSTPVVSARGGPRIGIPPLKLMGTEATENYLAEGLAEEITTGLSRFRWLSLVSTPSISHAFGEGRDDAALRQSAGLDYLLDGTVQRAMERLRITLRLVDLRDGNQVVWTRRFDRPVDDLLSIQDEVAAEAVAQIDPELLRLESRRALMIPLAEASAMDLTLRALPAMTRSDRGQFLEAGEFLRRALEKQPDIAASHTWSAYWLTLQVEHGWAEHPDSATEAAARHAERAITLEPQNARAFSVLGHIRAMQRRIPEAISLHERALALNPNLGMAWALSGLTHLYAGDLAEAERMLRQYKQLSPTDPFAFQYDIGFSTVALLKRDYEAAANLGRAASELNPDFGPAYKPYLAALGYLDRAQETTLIRRRLLAAELGFNLRRLLASTPFARAEDRDLIMEGLRRAGVAEDETART